MLRSRAALQSDFDWGQLSQLAGEDANFETELLVMFLADAEASLARIEDAVASGNVQEIADAAHSLKGASANVGACALARVASQMEQSAREGRIASALLKQMHDHCKSVQAQLQSRQ